MEPPPELEEQATLGEARAKVASPAEEETVEVDARESEHTQPEGRRGSKTARDERQDRSEHDNKRKSERFQAALRFFEKEPSERRGTAWVDRGEKAEEVEEAESEVEVGWKVSERKEGREEERQKQKQTCWIAYAPEVGWTRIIE